MVAMGNVDSLLPISYPVKPADTIKTITALMTVMGFCVMFFIISFLVDFRLDLVSIRSVGQEVALVRRLDSLGLHFYRLVPHPRQLALLLFAHCIYARCCQVQF